MLAHSGPVLVTGVRGGWGRSKFRRQCGSRRFSREAPRKALCQDQGRQPLRVVSYTRKGWKSVLVFTLRISPQRFPLLTYEMWTARVHGRRLVTESAPLTAGPGCPLTPAEHVLATAWDALPPLPAPGPQEMAFPCPKGSAYWSVLNYVRGSVSRQVFVQQQLL